MGISGQQARKDAATLLRNMRCYRYPKTRKKKSRKSEPCATERVNVNKLAETYEDFQSSKSSANRLTPVLRKEFK